MAVALLIAGCGDDDGAVDSGRDTGALDSAPTDSAPSDVPADVDNPLESLMPTEPATLGPENVDGQDEDPSIVVAHDGTLVASWYSNRAGVHPDGRERKELFVSSSTDGVTWSAPAVQVTDHFEWSFYPSLGQGQDGTFHLAWMRWHLRPADCIVDDVLCPGDARCCTGTDRRIMYNSATDALGWDAGNELELTSGPDDELPSIVAAADGRLLVYFASGYREDADGVKRIYGVVREGSTWGPATLITSVSSELHHGSRGRTRSC
jgi:hypothetical protein